MSPAGSNLSPHIIMEDPSMNTSDSLGNHSQIMNTGKPPRNLSVMRHCTSSTLLADSVRNQSLDSYVYLSSSSSSPKSSLCINLTILCFITILQCFFFSLFLFILLCSGG